MADTPDRRSFLFVSGSTREGGNAELLARRAAQSLPGDVEQRWVALRDLELPPFVDLRHAGGWGQEQPVVLDDLLAATLAATDLVVVSPLYWYTVTASVKLYLDHWTRWLRLPGVEFRARMTGKRLWAVTVVSTPDCSTTDPLAGTLRLTAEYLHMTWCGALVGYGNRPGDVAGDDAALAAAGRFFVTASSGGSQLAWPASAP